MNDVSRELPRFGCSEPNAGPQHALWRRLRGTEKDCVTCENALKANINFIKYWDRIQIKRVKLFGVVWVTFDRTVSEYNLTAFLMSFRKYREFLVSCLQLLWEKAAYRIESYVLFIPGYRHIKLKSDCNQALCLPVLFVYIKTSDYVPSTFSCTYNLHSTRFKCGV